MRERPSGLADVEVLTEVRRSWDPAVDAVTYLPVGFGAHHWAASVDERNRWFVTFDERRQTDLDAAYAGASALRDTGELEFVLAPVLLGDGVATVPLADGRLSCTQWYDGTSGGTLDTAWTARALRRLHTTAPPATLPRWRPKVRVTFAEETLGLTEHNWGPGPYADRARSAVRSALDDIGRWTERYHHLAEEAVARPWVACHGEPHSDNQLQTASGRFLVDWDTLRLAPPELDLRTLVDAGVLPAEAGADPEMLELFDLEWRLDEISQYAEWFAAPHSGNADDEIAIADLLEELSRL